ncbi:putative toxin-antitoxin system toxin component, PIN family [Candidatus Woesearchaeota archaeon]|nr:putative toxin-antitoxin system toxin component, PIN family [Candidatus Woesearchaeota archaeon]
MIKITADTNTLVSATIAKGNEFELLKLAKEGKIKLILSLGILNEFKNVISRAKFSYPPEFINDEVKRILEISEMVFPIEKIDIIKEDPDDNKVLECAYAAKVDFIVSGDKHLLDLKEYKGIKIMTTKSILSIIKQNAKIPKKDR